MTATLEQTQSDLLRLINLAQRGEEVVSPAKANR
jgi:hypothetical protein